MNKKVHIAGKLEEVIEAESQHFTNNWRTLGLKAVIVVTKSLANSCLFLLAKILFCWRPQAAHHKHIVIYTVGTLGDNVLMLPAVAAIRHRYPDAKLTLITNCDGFSDYSARFVFGNSSLVDRFIAIPNQVVVRQGLRIKINIQKNVKPQCDFFVNLSPFGNRGRFGPVVKEMIFAKWLGAKCAVGFHMATYARKHWFNTVQHFYVSNEARRPRKVLQQIGLSPEEERDWLNVDMTARAKVLKLLASLNVNSGFALLNPGAKLAASHWPADRFGKVASWLYDKYGLAVLVNGTEGERALCESVVAASSGRAVSLAGRLSLQELVEMLRLARLCVTNNTGPMTLSAAVGLPTVVITSTRFSPTFFVPISNVTKTVFSFGTNIYSYDDEGSAAEDLLQISVSDIKQAVTGLLEVQVSMQALNYFGEIRC